MFKYAYENRILTQPDLILAYDASNRIKYMIDQIQSVNVAGTAEVLTTDAATGVVYTTTRNRSATIDITAATYSMAALSQQWGNDLKQILGSGGGRELHYEFITLTPTTAGTATFTTKHPVAGTSPALEIMDAFLASSVSESQTERQLGAADFAVTGNTTVTVNSDFLTANSTFYLSISYFSAETLGRIEFRADNASAINKVYLQGNSVDNCGKAGRYTMTVPRATYSDDWAMAFDANAASAVQTISLTATVDMCLTSTNRGSLITFDFIDTEV
jgi:hypothetical protein